MYGDNKMNKWNRLLAMLDHVFGFDDKKKSTFRKVGQSFDERTREYVFLIEYRVRRGDKADRQVGREQVEDKQLLQYINDLAQHAKQKSR